MYRLLLESTSIVYPVIIRHLQQQNETTTDITGSSDEPFYDYERDRTTDIIVLILWIMFVAPGLLYCGWRNQRYYLSGERGRMIELNRRQLRQQLEIQRMARARNMAATQNGGNGEFVSETLAYLTEEQRLELIDKEIKKAELLRIKVAKSFQENQNQMVIRKEDITSPTGSGTGGGDDGGIDYDIETDTGVNTSKHGGGTIQLPSEAGNRKVPNSCAICLEEYQPDETITWSTNSQCCHAFHLQCVTEYLVHLNTAMVSAPEENDEENGGPNNNNILSPCPCCRQSFCVIPDMADD